MTKLYGGDWKARHAPDPAGPDVTQSAAAYVRDSLDDLAALGINLKTPVDTFVSDIVSELETDDVENHHDLRYLLLCTLGLEDESDTGDPVYHSDDVWWLDLDGIDDTDSYSRIVRRLSQMARGAFDVSDVACALDVDGVNRLRLTFRGVEHTFTPVVDDNQVDPELLAWVDDLLVQSGSPKTFHVLPGEDEERLLLFTDAPTYTRLLDELLEWPRDDWHGKTPAQIMREDARHVPGERPTSTGRWKIVTLVGGICLLVAVLVVLSLGGGLPWLKNLTKDATTDYLDVHLPVGYTYEGEDPEHSRYGYRVYRFTEDTGEGFQCTASYEGRAMEYAHPRLRCSWAVTYALRHDDVLRQLFSSWIYDPHLRHGSGYASITFRDEADVPALAQAIAQALETIRPPATSDPDHVFSRYSLMVTWAPPGEDPRSVGSLYQRIGSEPTRTAEDVQRWLEEGMSSPR